MIKKDINDQQELRKLKDAMALKNISNMPARVKCAVLSWHTLKEALKERN
jgi:nitrogen fixation NifU-like protein